MTSKEIIKKMMASDQMSQWLGIEIIDYTAGTVSLKMIVRSEMVNGFDVCHGGITYSLADSALAFSSNSHGLKSMSIETSISHLKKVFVNDILTVTSEELSLTRKTGVYLMQVKNQNGEQVANFKGTVYRSEHNWE